jgi:putative transposase
MGYRRVHGELLVLGVKVAASTVWEVLHEAGIDPAPERSSTTWADFLRSQAGALLACDFFETVTLSGAAVSVRGDRARQPETARWRGLLPDPRSAPAACARPVSVARLRRRRARGGRTDVR